MLGPGIRLRTVPTVRSAVTLHAGPAKLDARVVEVSLGCRTPRLSSQSRLQRLSVRKRRQGQIHAGRRQYAAAALVAGLKLRWHRWVAEVPSLQATRC